MGQTWGLIRVRVVRVVRVETFGDLRLPDELKEVVEPNDYQRLPRVLFHDNHGFKLSVATGLGIKIINRFHFLLVLTFDL